ncbi:hypothetical protein [Candidatus Igneacidithiobacillus taiwanensis]|uniref:hypothetical protein n=1 Tax=Candidatus Igneacidithiobacillus taiwanensis TaxID=1945924 RepID=UPI00289E5DBA|nr:hypothetical protein [Candidatus Igneacidithiobacillus taiwanensis]
MSTQTKQTQQLFTVNTLADYDPAAFTKGGLRHLIFQHGEELEAVGAVIRLGAKILIDRERLLDWLREGNARRRG